MNKTFFMCCMIWIALAACGRQDEPVRATAPQHTNFDVDTFCYDGIEYFGTWNNNAFSKYALTGAVIDKDTMLPKKCDANSVTLK